MPEMLLSLNLKSSITSTADAADEVEACLLNRSSSPQGFRDIDSML